MTTVCVSAASGSTKVPFSVAVPFSSIEAFRLRDRFDGAVLLTVSTILATNTSSRPKPVWPGNVPVVNPATKSPESLTVTPAAESVAAVPN